MDGKYTDKQVCDILGDNHFSNLLQYVLHMFGTMPRSMTEEEIIQYLKMNRKIGIPLGFMPTEVQEWCNKNSLSLQIIIENRNTWDDYKNWVIGKKLEFTSIVCLSEDYEYHATKLNGEWVDFDINKNGDFEIGGIANDKNITIVYNWTQWNKPIRDNASKNFINGCCAFGGWQYKNCNNWYMYPMLLQKGHYVNCECENEPYKIEPTIPTKIRFWREIK